MGIKVLIEWQGLDTMISNLSDIEKNAPKNLGRQVAALSNATEDIWKENTHRRSGRLQEADIAHPDGLSFTLNNSTKYYDWVNDGHMTPRGWRTRHGYRLAKRRSHVEGQEMTEKAVEFIEENLEKYLSKFLGEE